MMNTEQQERYNQAVEIVLRKRDRLGGRMPRTKELREDPEIDFPRLAEDLGVKPDLVIIEVLHEMNRRAELPENVLDRMIYPGHSPMSNPEKRYSGAAIKKEKIFEAER